MIRSYEVAARLRPWLVLACCSLFATACLSTYDTEGEEFVEGCDDTAVEICNGLDDNCDGQVDEGCNDDGDEYCDASMDVEGSPSICTMGGGDCDDTNATVYPGAAERCSGVDESCNGTVDERCDEDGDGYCRAGADIVYNQDGSLPAVCSAGINDCDDGDATLTSPIWYRDADGDGYGVTGDVQETCTPDDGYVAEDGDCDDAEAAAYPENTEICDGIDNDCDNDVDEDASDAETWYADTDNDTFGDPNDSVTACEAPTGYVADDTDCAPTRDDAYPGAPEVCDDFQNDCDAAAADEGCNDDGDDYCDMSMTVTGTPAICPGGGDDCNDDDPNVYPGAPEVCDTNDYDCDGQPGVLGLNVTLARQQSSQGDRSALATNGAALGVAWAEEDALTRTLRFAEVNSNLQVVSQVTLTDEMQTIYDVGVAWDPASASWGVAYSGIDVESSDWVVKLVRLDSNLMVLSETLIDTGTDYADLQLFAAGEQFGILYDIDTPGDTDLYYASVEIMTDTLRAPNLVVTATALGNVSAVYRPANDAIYLVWTYDSTSPNRFRGGAINAINGNTSYTIQERTMPAAITSISASTIHILDDQLYLIYENRTGTSPYPLVISPLSQSMSASLPEATLATRSSGVRRALMHDGSDRVFIDYHYDATEMGYRTVFSRFNTSWSLQSTRVIKDGSMSARTPVLPSAVLPALDRWIVLDESAANGFFTLYSMSDSGFANSREPLTTNPNPSPINEQDYLRRLWYDETGDRFLVLQEDPAAPGQLETLYLNRDGTTTTPVSVGPYPAECGAGLHRFFLLDGQPACLGRDFDTGACTTTASVTVLDVATGTFELVDTSTWTSDVCNNPDYLAVNEGFVVGSNYVTLWANGDSVRVRLSDGAGGSTALDLLGDPGTTPGGAKIDRYVNNAYMQQLSGGELLVAVGTESYATAYHAVDALAFVIDTTGAVFGPTVLYDFVETGTLNYYDYVDLRFAGELDGRPVIVTREAHYDPGASHQEYTLKASVISDIANSMATVATLASTAGEDMVIRRARVIDDRLVIGVETGRWQIGYDPSLYLMAADAAVTEISLPARTRTFYDVFSAGAPGYYGVLTSEEAGGRMTVYDANGTEITSAPLQLPSLEQLSIRELAYDGERFLSLISAYRRLFLVDGTCSGSSVTEP